MGEDIADAGVRCPFVGDDDETVAARPEVLAPVVKPSCLLGDVRIHELHKERELAGTPSRGKDRSPAQNRFGC
jgi:hypothetical protein